MTDISRKRTLKEFFDGGADQRSTHPQKAKKGDKKKRKPLEERANIDDEQDQAIEKSLIDAKKALKSEEDNSK